MVESAQFHAAHGVTSDPRWCHKWSGGHLPWVSVYAYSKRLNGKSVQDIFRGNVEQHRTAHRQFKHLALAGRPIIGIVKSPQPLLRGYLDDKWASSCSSGVLVETKHTPDEQE